MRNIIYNADIDKFYLYDNGAFKQQDINLINMLLGARTPTNVLLYSKEILFHYKHPSKKTEIEVFIDDFKKEISDSFYYTSKEEINDNGGVMFIQVPKYLVDGLYHQLSGKINVIPYAFAIREAGLSYKVDSAIVFEKIDDYLYITSYQNKYIINCLIIKANDLTDDLKKMEEERLVTNYALKTAGLYPEVIFGFDYEISIGETSKLKNPFSIEYSKIYDKTRAIIFLSQEYIRQEATKKKNIKQKIMNYCLTGILVIMSIVYFLVFMKNNEIANLARQTRLSQTALNKQLEDLKKKKMINIELKDKDKVLNKFLYIVKNTPMPLKIVRISKEKGDKCKILYEYRTNRIQTIKLTENYMKEKYRGYNFTTIYKDEKILGEIDIKL